MKRTHYTYHYILTKGLILSLLFLIPTGIKAGENDLFFTANAGWLHQNGINVTFALEKEIRYHNAIELYVDLYNQWTTCNLCEKVCSDSFWNHNQTFTVGAAYKTMIHRGKNRTLRLRGGADIGTNRHVFVASVEVGLEYNYTLPSRLQLFVLQKNDIVFWGKNHFRHGVLVGIKIPLNRR